jgi:hypothetical protein
MFSYAISSSVFLQHKCCINQGVGYFSKEKDVKVNEEKCFICFPFYSKLHIVSNIPFRNDTVNNVQFIY